MSKQTAAIGLKSKTGRAIAVILHGPASSPVFLRREELQLWNKRIRATQQPYHQVMELPWTESQVAVAPAIEAIQDVATAALTALARDVRSLGFDVSAIAVVGPPDRLLERIGNPHIRAHAAEGVLFRRVLEVAAAALEIRSCSFRDPAAELKRPASEVRKVLTRLGLAAGRPWRIDEKSAAMAAWIALSSRMP